MMFSHSYSMRQIPPTTSTPPPFHIAMGLPDFTTQNVHLTSSTPQITQVLEPKLILHVHSANAAPIQFSWFIASSLVSRHSQLHHTQFLISICQLHNVAQSCMR